MLHILNDMTTLVMHANEAQNLNAEALGAKGLLEDDLHVGDVVPVPQRGEETVGEAHHHQVLNHLHRRSQLVLWENYMNGHLP